MNKRMHIIVVCGRPNDLDINKFRFLNLSLKLIHALDRHFYFGDGRKKLTFLAGKREKILSELESLFIEKSEKDICFFYIGHGNAAGLAVEGYRETIISYEELSLVFAHHSARLIMVNDCCYALAAEKALRYHIGEHLLIASSTARHMTTGGITDRLMAGWISGLIYEPQVFIPLDEKEGFGVYQIFDNLPNCHGIADTNKDGIFVSLRIGDPLDELMISHRKLPISSL